MLRIAPWPRTHVMVLSVFSAGSALAGAFELLVTPEGGAHPPPLEVLQHTPFASFLIPGLLLACVVGGTSLASAILAWRRSTLATDATILAGGALTVWIVAQAALLRHIHWSHAAQGTLGLVLLALGVRAGWRSQRPRHRWIISVTIAETAGFLVPICASILSTTHHLRLVPRAALLVAAGAVGGLALGLGQAWAFPFRVRRLTYTGLTALGAGIVWASVISVAFLCEPPVPLALAMLAAIAAAFIALVAVGLAQWLELRHASCVADQWIPWTALAWSLALPMSVAPGAFVEPSTPMAARLAVWACGGLLVAYVMAIVTWQGVRHLFVVALPMLEPRPRAPSWRRLELNEDRVASMTSRTSSEGVRPGASS